MNMKLNSIKRLFASQIVPDSFKMQNDYFMTMTTTSARARPISIDNSAKYTYKNFSKFCGVYNKNEKPICAFKYKYIALNDRVTCLSVIFLTKIVQNIANDVLQDLLAKGKLFSNSYNGLATDAKILSTTSNAYQDLLEERALAKHSAFISTNYKNGPFIEIQPEQYGIWKKYFCSVAKSKQKYFLLIPGNGYSGKLKANLGECITLDKYIALFKKAAKSSSGSKQSPKIFRPIPNNKLEDNDWKELLGNTQYTMLSENNSIAYLVSANTPILAQINAALKHKRKYDVNALDKNSKIAFAETLKSANIPADTKNLSDGIIFSKAFSSSSKKNVTLIFYYVKYTDQQNNVSYIVARVYYE